MTESDTRVTCFSLSTLRLLRLRKTGHVVLTYMAALRYESYINPYCDTFSVYRFEDDRMGYPYPTHFTHTCCKAGNFFFIKLQGGEIIFWLLHSLRMFTMFTPEMSMSCLFALYKYNHRVLYAKSICNTKLNYC